MILFRDGLEVDAELFQSHWHVPFRKLAVGMPVTAGVVAIVTHLAVGLGWSESLLLGALLSPTDPVLSSGVVTDLRVPRLIRHSLNLESGLNDGLALPAVLAFAAALDTSTHDFVWWRFVLQDVGFGLVVGVGCGLLASALMPRRRAPRTLGLYGLGVSFATYGLAVLPPDGNGFIAVFVAAIVLGLRHEDIGRQFADGAREVVELVKLAIFTVFGSLLTLHGMLGDGWGTLAVLAGTLLLARPIAVGVSLAGTGLTPATKAFMAWFGPKGVATIAFSLLILQRPIGSATRIFDISALVVCASVLAHGLSERRGVEWIAAREELRSGR